MTSTLPLPAQAPPLTERVRVSIVIVNWNTRDLLLGLLGSLLPDGSPAAGTEVIVVDNQSQDGSVEAAHELFPHAHVVAETHNFGFAHGVNRGIAVARGEWVLLLNTDAEADPKTIAALVAEADLHPDAAIFEIGRAHV